MKIPIALIISFISCFSFSQVVLKSDGPGNTYELINSILAPGYEAVENPECIHGTFGRHIAEVWDEDLKSNVFEFYSHVKPDNDRCEKLDRQRVEIKTYESSPSNLKGTLGETVTYKWKFRLPKGFQPSSSFTHLHQIKAVGGSQELPIFTLTARKAKVNQLIVIHNNENTVASADLSEFEGTWVEITEKIKIGSNVCISQRSIICSGGHDYRSASLEYAHKPIEIKDGAWICLDAKVLPGVTIGECSVVSAGEVVRKSIPDFSMLVSGQIRSIDAPK